ncbi:TPA: twin-arginine translocation signal domain-containing protein, partial [Candidatus Poribacteria bacterium]|nr:twin-arginine translocation signal domain-containing protein [Candidatus Poribacteria bacterium]
MTRYLGNTASSTSRRDFLRLAGGGLGWVSLFALLSDESKAA